MRTFVYTRILICAPSYVRSPAPLYHLDTLVNPDTYIVFLIPGDAAEYSKHLFRVLDSDNDNMVSWKEVMVGFHQLSPNGDPDAKLRLVYSVSFDFWRENSNILVFLNQKKITLVIW